MQTRKEHTKKQNNKLITFLKSNKIKDDYCIKFHYWEDAFILYEECKGGQSDQIFMLYQIDIGKNLKSLYKRNINKFNN